MCYACDPRQEVSVIHITALLDGHDGLDKSILEDIIGKVLVFQRMVYVHVKAVFVSLQELIKGLVRAIDI